MASEAEPYEPGMMTPAPLSLTATKLLVLIRGTVVP
jgi:hypothetical protein